MSGEDRQWLRLLVAAWYVAGAVLVMALLAKSDVDGLSGRVGGSALAVVLLGFATAAGVRLAERPTGAGLFGALTVLISTAALLLTAVEVWAKHPMQQAPRTVATAAVAVMMGAICLILDSAREEDESGIRLARATAVFGLLALAVLTVLAASGVNPTPRLAGIAAALFVVPTLSLPALRALTD